LSQRITTESMELRIEGGDRWSAQIAGVERAFLGSGGMSVAWQEGRRRREVWVPLDRAAFEERHAELPAHGLAHVLEAKVRLAEVPLEVKAEWALVLGEPMLLWRVRLEHDGPSPLAIHRIGLLERRAGQSGAGVSVRWGADRDEELRARSGLESIGFYSQGWQSWAFAGTLQAGDRFPRTRLGPLTTPPRVNPGTPQPRQAGVFAADMFGVMGDRAAGAGLVVGFLGQREAFGSLVADLRWHPPTVRLWANMDGVVLGWGDSIETDWACLRPISLRDQAPLGGYLDAAARESCARRALEPPVGWCSWYYFFEDIIEDDVLANLNWCAQHRDQVPLELIQLDDGFEAHVGDWLDMRPGFPSGLRPLRDQVIQAGFRPGVWLAPYIATPRAKVVQDHPDWILRTPRGRPVNAGFLWNTFSRALDVTHPGVLDYVDRVMQTATEAWGFNYLKLDFLFAGALAGQRYDPSLTRAQALRAALDRIRRLVGPDVTLVGCGCPLGSGIGIFDSMRISADVAPRWRPAFKGIETFFAAEPDFPSARNAVRNILTRAEMHRRWWVNDPDCVLMRDERPGNKASGQRQAPRPAVSSGRLTPAEVQTVATAVSLSAGSLLVSDHLPDLDAERVRWLAKLLPLLPRAARVLDWFETTYPGRLMLTLQGAAGAWALMALVNWSDEVKDLRVRLGEVDETWVGPHHAVDFWRESYALVEDGTLVARRIQPHGVGLYALRPVGDAPAWIGDTLHISQGLAVAEWRAEGPQAEAVIDLGRRGSGKVWLSLPSAPTRLAFD
jgi:alpha-galactosidase